MDALHAQPILKRPPRSWLQSFQGWLFLLVFLFGCFMVHFFQLIYCLPLLFIPFESARELYKEGIRYTKLAFGTLLVLMCQWFAPTQLSITFERQGLGRFTEEEIKKTLVKDDQGRVVSLNLPQRSVVIANHQAYSDWWYAWCLLYLSRIHKDVFIVLKNSLKWVPVVGWGMQLYDFIFLARSWAADRVHLVSHLARLGRAAEQEQKPFTFLIYPEGTLVSKDTRPVSKKYADKLGVDDMKHCLLPRSTGLHYSLRSLSPKIPDLKLIDITVVYPGIPPMGYGQSYYTLRSIFMDSVPPPVIHMHLRQFDVSSVPIGDISSTNKTTIPKVSKNNVHAVEADVPQNEKDTFDEWLRQLWRDKDAYIDRFLEAKDKDRQKPVLIPLELRSRREILDAFCWFLPAAAIGLAVRYWLC